MENADPTHFVFNIDKAKTLEFIGDKQVRRANVVSGGEAMKMMVRISGKHKAQTNPYMIVLKNATRSYPIQGLPDKVPRVYY